MSKERGGASARLWLAAAGLAAAVLPIGGATAVASSSGLTPAGKIVAKPFVGGSVSLGDNEGLAYDPITDELWIADDSTGQLYAVERSSGKRVQTITKSMLRSAPRYVTGAISGASRAGDLEALAYDPATDTMYAFSGNCCTSSARPTVFRLVRQSGRFTLESWQPLSSPYNDLSGASVVDGEIWAGAGAVLVRFDYITGSAAPIGRPRGSSASTIYGVGAGPGADDLWLAFSGNHVVRYSASTLKPVAGSDFAMSSLGVRDARAVEPVGSKLYVSDGYDKYGSSSRAFAVEVYDVAGSNGRLVPTASA